MHRCFIIYQIAQKFYERHNRYITLKELSSVLYRLEQMFYEKYGRPLLNLKFDVDDPLYGIYVEGLEDLLTECEKCGFIKYKVIWTIPPAPVTDDPDYTIAVIDHELSRVDAHEVYLRKYIVPKQHKIDVPEKLERLLREAGCSLSELECLIEKLV